MPYHGDPPPLQQFGLMCSSINLTILKSALGYRLQVELQITWWCRKVFLQVFLYTHSNCISGKVGRILTQRAGRHCTGRGYSSIVILPKLTDFVADVHSTASSLKEFEPLITEEWSCISPEQVQNLVDLSHWIYVVLTAIVVVDSHWIRNDDELNYRNCMGNKLGCVCSKWVNVKLGTAILQESYFRPWDCRLQFKWVLSEFSFWNSCSWC